MNYFTPEDILNFAIKIEEEGEEFYRNAAKLSEDDEIASVFNRLAEDEVEHKEFFENMKSEIDEDKKMETYPEEYISFVESYISNVVFPDDDAEKTVKKVDDPLDAVNFAIKAELDSILFYHETMPLMAMSHHKTINRIIEEERKHFMDLLDIKKKLK